MSKKENNKELKNKEKCKCGEECQCQGENKHSEEKRQCTDECGCKNEHKANEEETIKKMQERINSLEDSLLRNQAELLNYRKRKDEETARILKYAEEDLLKGFLPILDNFERAIMMDDNNFGDETSKFLEGFRIVYNQTKELLNRFEVTEIDCLGKEFDPATSQAISTNKDETKPSGEVLKVYQKGYMYKDKVIRHAMVIVNE